MYVIYLFAILCIQLVYAAPLVKRDCPPGTQLVFSPCTSLDPGCSYDPRYGYISLSCAPQQQGSGGAPLAIPNLALPDMTNSVPTIPALPELAIPLGD